MAYKQALLDTYSLHKGGIIDLSQPIETRHGWLYRMTLPTESWTWESRDGTKRQQVPAGYGFNPLGENGVLIVVREDEYEKFKPYRTWLQYNIDEEAKR